MNELVLVGTSGAMTAYTAVALAPVWVPYKPGDEKKPERKGRAPRGGPNGEPAESGRWLLAYPDGRLHDGPKISVSALDTASECLHKWALDRLDGLEKQKNHKAELGGERHDELEGWIKFGKMTDTPGMAKVFAHFPTPGACESEVYFGFVFGRPGREVVIAGYIDARESVLGEARYSETCETFAEPDYVAKCGTCRDEVVTDGVGCPACGCSEVVYEMGARPLNSTIRDLKTTGDFRWMKSPAQLKANIQAAAYAYGEMLRVDRYTGRKASDDDVVILKWTYAHLKESKAGVVSIGRVETVNEVGDDGGVAIMRSEAMKVLLQYLPLAERLQEAILSKRPASEMEKSPEACRMYGGCAWRELEVPGPVGALKPGEPLIDSSALDARPGEKGYIAPSTSLVVIGDMYANGKRFACVPPQSSGGGVLAFLRQEKARSGVLPQSRVLASLVASTPVEASNEKEIEIKGASGLRARFAKKSTQVGQPQQIAGSTHMGLGARFAKAGTTATPKAEAKAEAKTETKVTAQDVAKEVAKVDQKAEAQGQAAVATGTAVSKPGGSLKNRLTAIAGGKDTPAAAAADNAPKQSVQTAASPATGINPPDASTEWTQEQQDAEAARIAASKGAVTDGAADTTKKKRKAAGSIAAPADVAAPTGDVNEWAIATLDLVARSLLDAGQRRQAAAVMGAAASF